MVDPPLHLHLLTVEKVMQSLEVCFFISGLGGAMSLGPAEALGLCALCRLTRAMFHPSSSPFPWGREMIFHYSW